MKNVFGIALLLIFLSVPAARAAKTEPLEITPVPDEKLQAIVKSLTLRERVAQLMLVTLEGLNGPSDEDRTILKDCTPGGVVIPLIADPVHAVDYIKALRATVLEQKKHIPMLVGADIYSLTRPDDKIQSTFAQMPSLLSIAAAGEGPSTEILAGLIAEYLSAMGFNLSVGPSLELAPTLPSAAETLNTLGSSPEFAAQAGGAFLDALTDHDLIAMPTGFPGGGANREIKGPASLSTPRETLPHEDLLPYIRAMGHGAPMMHVANTLVPTLDSESRPASLSPAVMRDLLRKELGFKGVIVAGPLDSSDIIQNYDVLKAVIHAFNAGADMIYWEKGNARVMKCVEGLARAVESGALDEKRLDDALMRVLQLKLSRQIGAEKMPTEKNARSLDTAKRFAKEAYDIERRSVTLIQNNNNVLPLSKKASMPIGITGVAMVDEMKDALEKHLKPLVEQPIATARHVGDIEDFEIKRLFTDETSVRTVICVFSGMKRTTGEIKLIQAFKKSGARVVVVCLGHPAPVAAFTEADAIILAYCDATRSEESIKAIADILAGDTPLRIEATSREIPVPVGKAQLFDVANVVRAPAGRLPLTLSGELKAGFAVSYNAAPLVKKALWDFGDNSRAKDLKVEHTFKSPGKFTVTLTVTDHSGGETKGAFTIVAK